MLESKDSSLDTVENVRVFIRIRPLKDKEKSSETQKILYSDNNTISLNKNGLMKTFTFCKVFDEISQQIDLYRHVSVPIVEQVLKGYNGTIFAYGQSGTGKTYTMVGDITDNNKKGIVPNIFSHIFAQITLANQEYSYAVTVTYLEIYNEEIRDLLSDQPKKLTLKEKPGIGVYVKDLLGFTVDSLEGVTEILKKGNKNRATSFTQLNDVSSRSHAVFTVLIETKNHTTNKTTFGKLNLVDLAGSERVHKSLATGDRLREAGKINLSLSVLGNVISALVDGKATHIPYRNSKLTRLLQDSLGGNSLTAMIAMVSPRAQDCEETLYTLMYADRVKHIQNHVTANVEAKSVIETFETKIAELREQLMLLEAREEKLEKKEKKRTKSAVVPNNELEDIETEKSNLQNKINIIQKKILVGGENLVEKAQQQMELLEHVDKELQHLDTSHSILKEILLHKEKEKTIVKKEYADLKEEDKALDSKLEEVDKLMSKAVEILKAKENEYQNEICTLLYNNKSLAKETSLAQFVIKESIPKEYLSDLKGSIIWDENTQEWQVKGIAYCGNNLRRTVSRGEVKKKNPDSVYLSYPKRSKLKPRN